MFFFPCPETGCCGMFAKPNLRLPNLIGLFCINVFRLIVCAFPAARGFTLPPCFSALTRCSFSSTICWMVFHCVLFLICVPAFLFDTFLCYALQKVVKFIYFIFLSTFPQPSLQDLLVNFWLCLPRCYRTTRTGVVWFSAAEAIRIEHNFCEKVYCNHLAPTPIRMTLRRQGC